MTTPEWLANHGGAVKRGPDGASWFVVLGVEPHYQLTVVPVTGKHGCHVKQTINGRRLDKGAAYATPEEAFAGGLSDLRIALGW